MNNPAGSGTQGGQVQAAVTVLLSLGSNVEPERHLRVALEELRARFGALTVSPAYRTAAVGFDGAPFINNAVMLQSDDTLVALEAWLHALEDRHGRDRSGPRLSDRTLDVDVVFHGDLVVREGERVRVPRPELRHAFVLKPLADLAPDYVHPRIGRSLAALWAGSGLSIGPVVDLASTS